MARVAKDNTLAAELWAAATALRGSMDASKYKNVVLGLVFLKYVSDAFEARAEQLDQLTRDPDQADYYTDDDAIRAAIVEDPDEYRSVNVFWVPEQARWSNIAAKAGQPNLGELIDDAMLAIENDNDRLRGVLPRDYASRELDKTRLKQVVDLVSNIGFADLDADRDILGRVYEYFLMKFDMEYGRGAGEFYTPKDVVELLVSVVEPYSGRVYDACAGSGGMFVQSARFLKEHGGSLTDVSVYGQEYNPTTWKLAKMNMALQGINADLGDQWADTFRIDKHPDLRAMHILMNPAYNQADWHRVEDDPRWRHFGVPPAGNANYAWMQHAWHHLAPGGTAGIVMANGAMSTGTTAESAIRKAMVEADAIDCIVTLPSQLFYTTQIPVCLFFLSKGRDGTTGQRDRRGEFLFLDGKNLGEMVSRTNKELTGGDIAKISDAYRTWRSADSDAGYEDVAGFSKSATLDEIAAHDYVLTPGRYVGLEEVEDDGIPIEVKLKQLVSELEQHFVEGAQLAQRVRRNLRELTDGL